MILYEHTYEDFERHRHQLLISRLFRRVPVTFRALNAPPFTHLLLPPPPCFLHRYNHAHCTKNERGSIVEEGEPYSCIEHSRHVGSQ